MEAGGGGGNIGNKNFNGGGDGGDYFGEDGDDDGGDDGGFFGRRLALPEVIYILNLFRASRLSSLHISKLLSQLETLTSHL